MSERSTGRLLLLAVLVAVMMLTLVGRTAQLQWQGARSASATAPGGERLVPIPAPRGIVVDRTGRPLVDNSSVRVVTVDPSRLAGQDDDGDAVLRRLSRLLDIPERHLRARLIPCGAPEAQPAPLCNAGSTVDPVVVAQRIPWATALPIVERPEVYVGVAVRTRPERHYPQEAVRFAHVLGYLGQVSEQELEQDRSLSATDLVGRGGLEQQYDAELRGTPGLRRVRLDRLGAVIDEETVREPVPGATLVTSLDADLQRVVERQLDRAVRSADREGAKDPAGAAVVLDARTGRVLALASNPDYAPGVWSGGISEEAYRALEGRGALGNNATSGLFAPGSTFKPFTTLAMLRSGFATGDSYRCPARYRAGGRTFRNYESENFGSISLRRAIEVSCNTVFYRAAERLWKRSGGERREENGVDPIAQAAADYGLGSRTGVDLPAEAAGRLASPASTYALWQDRREAWCKAAQEGYPELARTRPGRAAYFTELDADNCLNGNLWQRGDAINAGIGQGITAITPLQLAVGYSAIGGDGTVRSPRIGERIVAADGSGVEIAPTVSGRRNQGSQRRWLAGALSAVTASGTASGAFEGFPLDEWSVAGKTGTAQVEGRIATSLFGSFAPAQDAQYVVVVAVSEGGTGGGLAAGAARGVYDAIHGVGRPALFPEGGPGRAGQPEGADRVGAGRTGSDPQQPGGEPGGGIR